MLGILVSPRCLNPFPNKQVFTCLQHKSFENTVGKEEIAISPIPSLFSTCLDKFLPFSSNLKMSSANYFSLEEHEICRLGKGQPFTTHPNFSLVKIQSICKGQIKCC